MAREIVLWCDQCLDDDQKVPGLTREFAEAGKQFTVDLCDQHYKPLHEALERLREFHQPIRKREPVPASERVPCPVEGCSYGVPEGNRARIMSHLRTVHDVDLAQWETEQGIGFFGEPLPYGCPECDRRFTASQGLAMHRKHAHGIAGNKHHGKS